LEEKDRMIRKLTKKIVKLEETIKSSANKDGKSANHETGNNYHL
jgi:hypothetical protein